MSEDVAVKHPGELRSGDTVVYFESDGQVLRGIVQAIIGNKVRIGGVLVTISAFAVFLVIA